MGENMTEEFRRAVGTCTAADLPGAKYQITFVEQSDEPEVTRFEAWVLGDF